MGKWEEVIKDELKVDASYLCLSDEKISDKDCKEICQILKGNKKIEILRLNDNVIGPSGCSCLTELLADGKTPSLSILKLNGNKIGDKGCIELARGLEKNRIVTDLVLSNNSIGDKGCGVLATMLQTNSVITELHLSGNKITDIGCKKLEKSIRSCNTHVSNIELDDNPNISPDVKKSLISLVNKSKKERRKMIEGRRRSLRPTLKDKKDDSSDTNNVKEIEAQRLKEAKEFEKERKKMTVEVERLKQTLKERERDISTLTDDLEQVKDKLDEEETEKEKLEDELEELKEEVKDKIEEVKENLSDDLQEKIDELEEEVEHFKKEAADYALMKKKTVEDQAELARLNKEAADYALMKKKTVEDQAELARLNKEAADYALMKKKTVDNQAELASLKKEFEEKQSEVQDLIFEKNALSETFQSLKNQIKKLEKEAEKQVGISPEVEAELQTLRSENTQLQKDLKKANHELDKMNRKYKGDSPATSREVQRKIKLNQQILENLRKKSKTYKKKNDKDSVPTPIIVTFLRQFQEDVTSKELVKERGIFELEIRINEQLSVLDAKIASEKTEMFNGISYQPAFATYREGFLNGHQNLFDFFNRVRSSLSEIFLSFHLLSSNEFSSDDNEINHMCLFNKVVDLTSLPIGPLLTVDNNFLEWSNDKKNTPPASLLTNAQRIGEIADFFSFKVTYRYQNQIKRLLPGDDGCSRFALFVAFRAFMAFYLQKKPTFNDYRGITFSEKSDLRDFVDILLFHIRTEKDLDLPIRPNPKEKTLKTNDSSEDGKWSESGILFQSQNKIEKHPVFYKRNGDTWKKMSESDNHYMKKQGEKYGFLELTEDENVVHNLLLDKAILFNNLTKNNTLKPDLSPAHSLLQQLLDLAKEK